MFKRKQLLDPAKACGNSYWFTFAGNPNNHFCKLSCAIDIPPGPFLDFFVPVLYVFVYCCWSLLFFHFGLRGAVTSQNSFLRGWIKFLNLELNLKENVPTAQPVELASVSLLHLPLTWLPWLLHWSHTCPYLLLVHRPLLTATVASSCIFDLRILFVTLCVETASPPATCSLECGGGCERIIPWMLRSTWIYSEL